MSTRTRDRRLFVACTLLYIVAFQLAYVAITPIWGYAGFTFEPPPIGYWIGFSAIAMLPSLWIRPSLSRPSQWLYLYLYAIVVIPTCLVPLFRAGSQLEDPRELVPLVAVMLICMMALGFIYQLPLIRFPRFRPPRVVFWMVVAGATVVAYATVYRVFGASLRLTSDVVAQRLLARDTFASTPNNAIVGYALNWPSYAINPLLLAIGLWYRRRSAVAVGVAGQAFAYAVNAARGPMAAVPVLFMLWFSLRQRRVAYGNLWMSFFALIVGCAIVGQRMGRFLAATVSWVFVRTFAMPGYITGIYYDYFRHSPMTMFSHIRGLGWLGHNPYGGTSLGFVIGKSLGQPENNANANLWADGFASYGLLGMIFVTVLAAVLFHIIDSALARTDSRFAATALGAQAMNLADIPIFTTLLGGGLGLIVLLMYLMPVRQAPGQPLPVKAPTGPSPLGHPQREPTPAPS